MKTYRDAIITMKKASAYIDQLEKEITQLKIELARERKGNDFYGNEDNWSKYGECKFTKEDLEQFASEQWHDGYEPEYILEAEIGGKTAREIIAQRKVELD